MKIKQSSDQWPVPSDQIKRVPLVPRHAALVTCHSRSGIALVITLIMLSVTLLMAVAFLALAKRERGSVSTGTDSAMAQQAARAAVDQAQGQILANILSGFSGYDSTNAYNLQLLVSTNYINYSSGFKNLPNPANPTNVNYFDGSGNLLTGNNFIQNVANLSILPRPPVFVPTNIAGSPLAYDFRYYLDLNENGRFDQYGLVPQIQPNGEYLHTDGTVSSSLANVVTNLAPGGDPEWIGVLEHPDAPHGPNNHFIARYAFLAVPAGNAMDINYVHNQALNTALNPRTDGYFRNQGVGSWEINLAAFLADLNTNTWSPVALPANLYYSYNEPNNGGANSGYAFQDALSLLKYRYNSNALPRAMDMLANANRALPASGMDTYTRGPLQTGLDYNRSASNPPLGLIASLPWSGANNTNHFFTPADLLDGSKLGAGLNSFTNRLRTAGLRTVNGLQPTYDRYTYYRMLSQLGSDSSPDDGKLNLNYSNAVVNYRFVKGVNVPTSAGVVAGAETNLVPWTPQNFFHAAADQLLRTYTAEWFQTSPTNFMTTYYGYIPRGPVGVTGIGLTNFPFYGQTNQIPTFGITNIPVWVNSNFVYSPAVNRLLQLAANLYDATTNGPIISGKALNLPHVFRPIFEHDTAGNVFIVGFTNLYSSLGPNTVSGQSDPQLALPHPVTDLPTLISASYTPIYDGNGLVNVYGVPWIIGAKQGLPNFNQFYMINAAQVTRKLQVSRSSLQSTATYTTNQMYILGISNTLGVTFWNSYSNAYPRPLKVSVSGSVYLAMTNRYNAFPNGFPASGIVSFNYGTPANTTVLNWPGSQWSGTQPNLLPQSTSFLPFNWSFFISPEAYDTGAHQWDPSGQWPKSTGLTQLDQFGLMVTNYLQAYILDGNNVIDYVQLGSPVSTVGLNQALAEPFPYPGPNTQDLYRQWYTNAYNHAIPPNIPQGVINQILVSLDPTKAPLAEGQWRNDPTPMGIATPQAEAAFFNGFFYPSFQFNGVPYVNRELVMQAPYTPSRYVYSSYLLQANDPLVHYLASDLNAQTGARAVWQNRVEANNGIWAPTDDLQANPLPKPPLSPLSGRYQPWGQPGQMAALAGVDNNVYNLAYKDPLAWGSDSWDFPTNLYPSVGWIGRVHRGTPWQTVNLKSTNILWYSQGLGVPTGSNTWAAWSGDLARGYFGQSYYDAANAAPMEDRLLFDIFTTRFNDNAVRGTLPVNQTQIASWSALLSGLVVVTNTGTIKSPNGRIVPTYTTMITSPAGVNAAGSQLSNIVANINATRASSIFPYHAFTRAGDVLLSPALSDASPYLRTNSIIDRNFGISDEMYEWLPQQVMGLVRGTEQRYVLYCWGQALRPAPGGKVLGGTYSQLVTNYQVVAESAVRAVVRVDKSKTSQPHAVVESYNVLPPQ